MEKKQEDNLPDEPINKDDLNSSSDESMNKYDSEEENSKSPEIDLYKDLITEEANKISDHGVEPKSLEEEMQELNIGSVISKIKDFDNDSYNYSHLKYQDQKIIKSILNVNKEKNISINSLNQLFLLIMKEFSHEDIEQLLFFNETFIYLLKKTFFTIKTIGTSQELINIFDLIQRFCALLLSKNIIYLNSPKNQSKNQKDAYYSLCALSLQEIDYVIELYFIFVTVHYLSQPDDFFDNSLIYLLCLYSNKEKSEGKKGEKDNCFVLIENENDAIYIKKYIETFHQIIKNRKKLRVCFSLEQYKNIFSLGFFLLRDKMQININYFIIEMLCDIIELVEEDGYYIDKFIVEYLICFNYFLEDQGLNRETNANKKFNKDLYPSYLHFYGEYQLTNSEHISLFTYFFVKTSCLLYTYSPPIFEKFMEDFLHKIIFHNNDSFLLYIIFIFKDLVKMKYDIEFSICIHLITHIYLTITSLLSQSDINIKKKKFLATVIQFFLDNLLKDLLYLRGSYLCFGKNPSGKEKEKIKEKNKDKDKEKNNREKSADKKKKKNKKNQNETNKQKEKEKEKEKTDECKCFSCNFCSLNDPSQNFKCGKCGVTTNLRLQLLDPNKDDDLTVCGFCNINDYFESFANIFENEDKLNLLKINDNSLVQYTKTKLRKKNKNNKKQNNNNINLDNENDITNNNIEEEDPEAKIIQEESINNQNNPDNYLFDKCIHYQEMIYKKVFLFLKINLLNFIYISNKNQTQVRINNINRSFHIFLLSLIQENKLKDKTYLSFIENLEQFFSVQKERVFNLHQDINIDEKTIQYFYFFHFYLNFLFSGHWKILEILISEKSHNWRLKFQCMKILELFVNIDKEVNIFQNYAVKIIGPLLCDQCLYIREFSFDLLFKLYQKKKIHRTDLIYILYNNINESSFIIRKRAIKALSDLVFYEKERESLKSIILIFLNKIYDNSESEKIKCLIYDFFIQLMKNNRGGDNELLFYFLNILIELFAGSESICNNYSNYTYFISTQLSLLFEKIHEKVNTYGIMIDYLMEKYIMQNNSNNSINDKENKDIDNDEEKNEEEGNYDLSLSLKERMIFIYSLNLVQILTKYHKDSISLYIDYFINFLEFKSDIPLHNNKIIQLTCMIINNYFNEKKNINENNNKNKKDDNVDMEDSISIKYNTLCKIENLFMNIIMNKAPSITFSALQAYFSMVHNGVIDVKKIQNFALMNFVFLTKIKDDSTKIFSTPDNIISKSLTIFSYIIYSLEDEEIITLFKGNGGMFNNLEEIKGKIFELLSFFYLFKYNANAKTKGKTNTKSNSNSIDSNNDSKNQNILNTISTKSFNSFTYFWVRFPEYLLKSDKIISKTFEDLDSSEEKMIVLQSFTRLFTDMSEKCEESRQRGENKFDFGIVHLFFETFIEKISLYLIEENHDLIRLEAIKLIKLVIDLGNLNVYKVIPYAFASLFDYISEIRCIAVEIISKGLSLSKEKTFNAFIEGLKHAFLFQKNKYVNTEFINSFVKIIDPETKEYKTSNENVFDLLFYKISKKNSKTQKKILEKYLLALKDVSNIEHLFDSNSNTVANIKKYLNAFDYYIFVTKLIGDYKYQSVDEVFSVYENLYPDFENILCVFKSKYKQYKEEKNNKKMDPKLVFYFLNAGIFLFLFRYLLIKYRIFSEEQLNEISSKGWKSFSLKQLEIEPRKKNKKLESKANKFKFIEFYSNFEILCIQVFDNQIKSNGKFKEDNKNKICESLSKLKSFANINENDFINLYSNKKKSYSDLTFSILFNDAERKNDLKEKRKSLFNTEAKMRNRISLESNHKKSYKEDKKSDDDVEMGCDNENDNDNNNNDDKEQKENENKRNAKHKIKLSETTIKKAKRKNKFRKTVQIIEDEKEESDE